MPSITRMIQNAGKHVGAGGNVNLITLARNAAPCYLSRKQSACTPLTVFVSVNSQCNLRCKMCDIGQRNAESSFFRNLKTDADGAELEMGRVLQVFAEIRTFRPRPRVSVTTTEPLLYRGLFDLGKAAHELGLEFQFTTNGLLLLNKVDHVFDANVVEVAISLDGKGELHDGIRGKEGLYENVKTALGVIAERKRKVGKTIPQVTIATTVSNFNYWGLEDLFDDLDEDHYQRAIVSHMNFIDRAMAEEHNSKFKFVGCAETAGLPGETDNCKVEIEILRRQIAQIKKKHPKVRFAPDYDVKELHRFYRQPQEFMSNNRCYIPWFVTEILANGDVIPLTRCIHIKLGNIYESTLSEIWNGEPYRSLRKHLQHHKRFPICRRCRGIL